MTGCPGSRRIITKHDGTDAPMADMMDYHTVEENALHVYHDNLDCPDGKKIKSEHYRSGKGVGRRLCEECEKL